MTPQGEAQYPHLAEACTKFKETGEYNVTMFFDDRAGSELLERLNEAYQQACNEAKAKYEEQKPQYKKDNPEIKYEQFYREEVDENGFATGRIFVRLKKDAKVKTKDGKVLEFKVVVFDRYNKPMSPNEIKKAGSGSIMKCAFKVSPYFVLAGAKAGITLKLEAVQIVESKEWNGSKSADDYGFKSFEDEDGEAFETTQSSDKQEEADF